MATVLACGRCKATKPSSEFSATDAAKGPGRWCKACHREYTTERRGITETLEPRPCVVCGATFVPKQRRRAVYCSPECNGKAYWARVDRSARNATRRARSAALRPSRQCLWCGDAIPTVMRVDAKFCSRSCTMAAHKPASNFARRSNKPKPAMVTLAELGVRDGWLCGLCGDGVSLDARYPDPLSASIDHVIPVSLGGTHDPGNLQLAHLGCNSRKRDRLT